MRVAVMVMVFLLGAASGWAFDVQQPERLKYDVMWGPLRMGVAEMNYAVDGKGNYVLETRVVDNTPLIEMRDSWRSVGVIGKNIPLVSMLYEVAQKENDYRADKVMVFDVKAKKINYINNIDKSDVMAPLKWDGVAQDVLATVYGVRAGGRVGVEQGGKRMVVGLKRTFTLLHGPGKWQKIKKFGKTMAVWDVELKVVQDGKVKKDSWTVRLRDDAQLTPVEIVANTKFGNFRAILKE